MAKYNVVLPVTVYIQVRDGVLNRVGSFEIDVFGTRRLKEEEKIAPDAVWDHVVRKADLAQALRSIADELEE